MRLLLLIFVSIDACRPSLPRPSYLSRAPLADLDRKLSIGDDHRDGGHFPQLSLVQLLFVPLLVHDDVAPLSPWSYTPLHWATPLIRAAMVLKRGRVVACNTKIKDFLSAH